MSLICLMLVISLYLNFYKTFSQKKKKKFPIHTSESRENPQKVIINYTFFCFRFCVATKMPGKFKYI